LSRRRMGVVKGGKKREREVASLLGVGTSTFRVARHWAPTWGRIAVGHLVIRAHPLTKTLPIFDDLYALFDEPAVQGQQ
jgi:hypothetical protein